MQSTPVEAPAQADFGLTTIVTKALDERYQKLLRFRALKHDLAELRAEYERLERELFAGGAL